MRFCFRSCRRRGACGAAGCGRFFPRRDNPGNRLSHRNVGTSLRRNSREHAVSRSFDFHHGFVGFDFEKRFALGYAIAFLFAPSNELAGFLRHLEGGHDNAEGHRFRRDVICDVGSNLMSGCSANLWEQLLSLVTQGLRPGLQSFAVLRLSPKLLPARFSRWLRSYPAPSRLVELQFLLSWAAVRGP